MVIEDVTGRGEPSLGAAGSPEPKGEASVGGQLTDQVELAEQTAPPTAPAPSRLTLRARIRNLISAIRDGQDVEVESAVLELSKSRRLFAPLAFVVSAFAMLFDGVKLLVSNWRLTLVQVLPAMWVWAAMLDIKLHLFHGKEFTVLRGPVLIPILLATVAVTAACFLLNAVFAFAISQPGTKPVIRPAFREARAHAVSVISWGLLIGLWLGVSAFVFPRWGRWWFAVSMSIVVGVMMFAYVALPSRLVGLKTTYEGRSRRDKVSVVAVGGVIGGIICTPPYLLGRVGILMLGSRWLFVPGILVLTLGVTLQAGATGAVKAIKMSAKLAVGRGDVVPGAERGTGPPASASNIAGDPDPTPTVAAG